MKKPSAEDVEMAEDLLGALQAEDELRRACGALSRSNIGSNEIRDILAQMANPRSDRHRRKKP